MAASRQPDATRADTMLRTEPVVWLSTVRPDGLPHLVPICFVSGKTGVGAREFLDLCVKLMPNPKEGNPPPFLKGEGDKALGDWDIGVDYAYRHLGILPAVNMFSLKLGW